MTHSTFVVSKRKALLLLAVLALLVAVVFFTLMPNTALAAATDYILMGGTPVIGQGSTTDFDNDNDTGTGWSWVAANKTLTIDSDYIGGRIVFAINSGDDVYLNVDGDVAITYNGNNGTLHVSAGHLYINGNGNLTLIQQFSVGQAVAFSASPGHSITIDMAGSVIAKAARPYNTGGSNIKLSSGTLVTGAVDATNMPTITGISPSSGNTAGGTNVKLTGTGLGGATKVEVGGTTATIVHKSDTEIIFTTPMGTAGTANVMVTTPGGTVEKGAMFTYADLADPVASYTLTVTDGTDTTGNPLYKQNAPVSITADAAPPNKVFDKWTTSDGGTFEDANSATTTYYMPAKSATVTATYKDPTAPAAPTGLAAAPGDGQLTLSWTAPNDGGSAITKYEYSTDDGATWVEMQGSGAGTTSYVLTGLTNGTSYTVKVRAVNAIGDGAVASITGTPAQQIVPPSGPAYNPGPPVWVDSPGGGTTAKPPQQPASVFPFAAETTKKITVYDQEKTDKKIDTLAKGADVTVIAIEDGFAIVEYTKDGETVTGAVALTALTGEFGADDDTTAALYGKTNKGDVRVYKKNAKGRFVSAGRRYKFAGAKVKIVGLENGYYVLDVKGETYYVKVADVELILE